MRATHERVYKSAARIIAQAISVCMGSFVFGYGMGVFNTVQENLSYQLNWLDEDTKNKNVGFVTAVVAAGAGLGALIGGNMASVFGRKTTMIITDVTTILSVIPTLYKNLYTILIGRLILGVCVGINSSVVPLYIREVTPLKLTGFTGSCHQLLITIGILISYILGLGLPKPGNSYYGNNDWWRYMFAVPIIPALIRIILLLSIFKSETATYLVSKDKLEEAESSLAEIYYPEYISEQLSHLKEDKQKASGKLTIGKLIGPIYRKALFVGCVLSIIQQFSGINAIIFYSTVIFKGNNSTNVDPNIQKTADLFTNLVGIINVVSALTAGLIIDKAGRKSILIFGNFLCIGFLCAMSFLMWKNNYDLAKYVILLYTFSFGMSLGPIVWIYIAEILPDKGVGIAVFTNWMCVLVIGLFFPILKQPKYLDSYGIFLFFAGCCIAGEIFLMIFVQETKGKNKMEIHQMFRNSQMDQSFFDSQHEKN